VCVQATIFDGIVDDDLGGNTNKNIANKFMQLRIYDSNETQTKMHFVAIRRAETLLSIKGTTHVNKIVVDCCNLISSKNQLPFGGDWGVPLHIDKNRQQPASMPYGAAINSQWIAEEAINLFSLQITPQFCFTLLVNSPTKIAESVVINVAAIGFHFTPTVLNVASWGCWVFFFLSCFFVSIKFYTF
jgi:hypothetical protein